jgi:hypothetical protein
MQAGLNTAAAAARTPEAVARGGVDGEGSGLTTDANGRTSTKYTGVCRNKGGRYSATGGGSHYQPSCGLSAKASAFGDRKKLAR